MTHAVFWTLILARNWGAWSYLFSTPSAFDARSVRILFVRGALPCAAVALFLLLCWGAGRRILRRMLATRLSTPPGMILATGFGLGIAATGIFIFGVLGALNFWGILVVMILLAFLAAPERRPSASRRNIAPNLPQPPEAWPAWKQVLAGLLAFAAFNALMLALAPPTEWDVLAYHLALPKLYVAAERVLEIPWLIHGHWPHLMESLYCLPVAAGADNGAALLHAAVCALWGAATYQAARAHLGPEASWIAAGLAAGQPLLLRFAGTAHADGAMALFHLLACLSLWRWSQGRDAGWLAVAGAFSGMAAASKLHGLVLAGALAAWAWRREGADPRARRRALAIFGLPALSFVAPWYLKTWTSAGNPVWPFFSTIFGGDWGAAAMEGPFLASSRWAWPPSTNLITLYGAQYLLIPAIGLSALAWNLGRSWPPFIKLLLWPIPFYLPLIIRQHEFWRFMLAVSPGLVLSAAFGASEAIKAGGRRALLAAALVAVGLWPIVTATQNNELFAVLGLGSPRKPEKDPRDLYLEKSLDHYAFYQETASALPSGAKVLLFREIRGYYLDARYQWGDPVNQGLLNYDGLPGPEELRVRLRELGITHVLVNEGLAIYGPSPGYYSPRTLAMMEDVLRNWGLPVLRREKLVLYALNAPSSL